MSLIAYALQARARGFHVFPVEPNGKTPHRLAPNQPFTLRWGEAATDNVGRIIDYWTRWPRANIGLACKPSGLLVVDCDFPKRPFQMAGTQYARLHDTFGPVVDGVDVYRYACESAGGTWAEAEDTYRVTTGSLGCHFYYRWPAGVIASQASIAKGVVDIRGNAGDWGGYVLAAGSETSKGGYVVELDAPIRQAPAWLVEMVRADRQVAKPAPSLFRQPGKGGSLAGLVGTVEGAQEGNRNSALLWAARAACENGIPQEEALEALGTAYVAVRGDGGYRQAEATIRSAYRLQGGK
ncbi:bifunctional DNA primase/polymerase [Streptomyces sp. SS7]|uniref:bifunctional DNA primase/polymerase n=1 Tax=Streptomyces sp. SS7 TaxID=3108485 RepID=UPI0030EB217F